MPAPKVNGTSGVQGNHADKPKEDFEKLILCFDGTGNQYSANTSDTNVVKLYQKFDRQAPNQYHYYQRKLGFRVLFIKTQIADILDSWNRNLLNG